MERTATAPVRTGGDTVRVTELPGHSYWSGSLGGTSPLAGRRPNICVVAQAAPFVSPVPVAVGVSVSRPPERRA